MLLASLLGSSTATSADYFLTIGGGYSVEQNQASLEANILFFQKLLADQHPGPARHDLFFADGTDPAADLQVLADPPPAPPPLTALLTTLHRRGGPPEAPVEYRNHAIPNVTGPLQPDLIHNSLSRIARQAKAGDRLVVYVTAHGREGPKEHPGNTTISCWDDKSIPVRVFSEWLNEVPVDVPVILVMAQCYCGGFANTIFEDVLKREELSRHSRIGFFAQQFDLPAAGCRPDIEQDQEFSSYFWGALIGRSRNGAPLTGADADANGIVSFEEAFAQAVIVGETVDIPLRASEALLRRFSRIPDYTLEQNRDRPEPASPTAPKEPAPAAPNSQSLVRLEGPLRDLAAEASPADRRIVFDLGVKLELSPDTPFEELLLAYRRHQQDRPANSGPNRRRGNSGRRELLAAIRAKWPDLADSEKWKDSPRLAPEREPERLLAEIQQLPEYAAYEKRRLEREQQAKLAEEHELLEVKYRRLVETVESLVLERNLRSVAAANVVEHFERMKKLERQSLKPSP